MLGAGFGFIKPEHRPFLRGGGGGDDLPEPPGGERAMLKNLAQEGCISWNNNRWRGFPRRGMW